MDEKALNAAKLLHEYCKKHVKTSGNCIGCIFHYRKDDDVNICSLYKTPYHYALHIAELNMNKKDDE